MAGLGASAYMAAAMFFVFVGVAANQFHGYLFEWKGRDALGIGLLFMSGHAAGVLAPFAQVFAIRWLRGAFLPLALVSFGAGAALMLLPQASGFAAQWFAFVVVSFCVSSAFPLLTAVTLETTRDRGHGVFVNLRGLGSAGFLAASLLCLVLPRTENLNAVYAVFGMGFFLALLAVVMALRHEKRRHAKMAHEVVAGPSARPPRFAKAWRRLFRGEAIGLMGLLAAMSFANVMATAMQGNYLVGHFGLEPHFISVAWCVATGCEIGWMALCSRLLRTWDLRRVMVLGLWGTLVKLVLLAFANHYLVYLAGLVFHGLFFSFALTGFGVYLDRRFRPGERPVLQALTTGLVQGLPAAAAGLAGGLIWEHVNLHAVYGVSALLAALICLWGEIWLRGRMAGRIGTFRFVLSGQKGRMLT